MIYKVIVGISMIASVVTQSCAQWETLRSEAGRVDFSVLKNNKNVMSLLSGSRSEVKVKPGSVLSLIPLRGHFKFLAITLEVKGVRDFTFTIHRPLQGDIHVLGRPQDPKIWEMIKIGLEENQMIGDIESVSITCDKKSGKDGMFIRNIHLIGCPSTGSDGPDPATQPPPTEQPTTQLLTTLPSLEPACTPVDMPTDLKMTKKPKKASGAKPQKLLNGVPIAIKPGPKAQMTLAVTAGVSLELHRLVIEMVGVESIIFKWKPADRKAQTLRVPVVDDLVDISLDPAESRSLLWMRIQYLAADGADVILINRLLVDGCTATQD